MELITQYSDTLRGSAEDSMDEDDVGGAMEYMTSRQISAPSAAPDVRSCTSPIAIARGSLQHLLT